MIEKHLVLKDTPFWSWSLFANQSYLGRVQLTLRRECNGSLADITEQEWRDLRANLLDFEAMTKSLFQPDRFNYVQLGNIWPQVHVHAIPRYAVARNWNGFTFTDVRWGDLPLPEPASPIGEAELARLVTVMRDALNTAG
ncbi:MAG: hypothetical protein KJ587_08410 [Alphaproteobacteria bacterium]|nr:hypothetical protein [Alphaproteobacteria bacterium]